jgi:hypothetical protein
METIKGTLRIKGRIFQATSGCGYNTKEEIETLLKEDAFQELYEDILDACNGWEWSDKQAHKLRKQIDNATIVWN